MREDLLACVSVGRNKGRREEEEWTRREEEEGGGKEKEEEEEGEVKEKEEEGEGRGKEKEEEGGRWTTSIKRDSFRDVMAIATARRDGCGEVITHFLSSFFYFV